VIAVIWREALKVRVSTWAQLAAQIVLIPARAFGHAAKVIAVMTLIG
jgi:hypothetical protein